MPESPYFYLMKGNIDEARKSLQQFRGVDDVQEELDRIESALREQNARKGNLLDLFTVRNNRKALMLSLGNNIINRLIMIVKDKLDMQITYCKANAMLFKKTFLGRPLHETISPSRENCWSIAMSWKAHQER